MAKLPRHRTVNDMWIVTVHSLPVEGRDWTAGELNDLADKYGYGTEEYYDALGPVDGHRSAVTYGPYTERQARKVANYISEQERVGAVVASPLFRYIPARSPGDAEEATDDE
jgi:hypothetical protein